MQTSFRGAVKNFQGLAVLVTVPALMTVARGAGVIGSRYRCVIGTVTGIREWIVISTNLFNGLVVTVID